MANFVYFFSLFDLETITLCTASTQQVMQILSWLVVLKNKLKSEILNVYTPFFVLQINYIIVKKYLDIS